MSTAYCMIMLSLELKTFTTTLLKLLKNMHRIK